jgi:hypothetical protein
MQMVDGLELRRNILRTGVTTRTVRTRAWDTELLVLAHRMP